jgi:hypothetical protein
MGQVQGKINNQEQIDVLANKLEEISSSLIFRQNFQDMKLLNSKDYCDELVVITQQMIAQKLNKLEVNYLRERIDNGMDEGKQLTKDKIIYLKRKDLDTLDETFYPTKSKICLEIAKFYIKCAHVYGAIAKTINPIYQYANSITGQVEHVADKKLIPVNQPYKRVYYNLCSRRIAAVALTPNRLGNLKTSLCDLNKRDEKSGMYKNRRIHSDKLETLQDEYGINDLEDLYRDVYDFNTKMYNKMSIESRQQYETDVKQLNMAIHNGNPPNPNAKTFSDIELIPYHKKQLCTTRELRKGIKLVKDSKEFVKYGQSLNKMIKRSSEYQVIFLKHLNTLCVKYVGRDGENVYKLNPKLTVASLDKLIADVRKDIVNSILECQEEFNELKEQLFGLVINKLKDLNKKKEEQMEKAMLE